MDIKSIIADHIWPLAFVYIITIVSIYFINKKADNKSQLFSKTLVVLIGCMVFSVYTYIQDFGKEYIQIMNELFCWIVILVNAIKNKTNIFKNRNIDNKYIYIFIIGVVFGIIAIWIMANGNYKYVSPSDEYGFIENFYYNADVHRGIETATTKAVPHLIHPGYRFAVMPIGIVTICITFVAKLANISPYGIEILNGYLLCLIQVVFNSFSAILFYKILKKVKVSEKISMLGTIMFIVSFSSFWLSILPETYAITLLLLLIYIYLYLNKERSWIVFALISMSTNLIDILPAGVILVYELIKNRKDFLNKIKKSTILTILVLVVVFVIIVIFIIIARLFFVDYLLHWRDNGGGEITTKLYESINYLVVPWLIAPNSININPYFVQLSISTISSILILIPCFFLMIAGYMYKRKEVLTNVCLVFLVIAYVLHSIFGYGRQIGIIYAPLYSWAFILLILYGIEVFYKNNKKRIAVVVGSIIIVCTLVTNISWLFGMASSLKSADLKGKENIWTTINPILVRRK